MSRPVNLATVERLASLIHERHGSGGLVLCVGLFCVAASETVVIPSLLLAGSLTMLHFVVGTMLLAGGLSASATLVLARIIDQRELVRSELDYLAHHDELTGVLNRRGFFKAGAQRAGACQSDQVLVVAMVDVDQFKRVNDTYGHQMGDLVLERLAMNLKSNIGDRCAVGRLGGDEFAVVGALRPHELDNVQRLVERSLVITVGDCMVNASAGFVVVESGTEIDDAIRRADLDLYREKRLVSNRA